MNRRRFFASPLALLGLGAAPMLAPALTKPPFVVDIRVEVDGLFKDMRFIEESVIPSLREALARRDVVIIPPNSRQAEALR